MVKNFKEKLILNVIAFVLSGPQNAFMYLMLNYYVADDAGFQHQIVMMD